jgi:hypothetical protein
MEEIHVTRVSKALDRDVDRWGGLVFRGPRLGVRMRLAGFMLRCYFSGVMRGEIPRLNDRNR